MAQLARIFTIADNTGPVPFFLDTFNYAFSVPQVSYRAPSTSFSQYVCMYVCMYIHTYVMHIHTVQISSYVYRPGTSHASQTEFL